MKWVVRILGGLVAILVLAVLVIFVMGHRPGAGTLHGSVEIARSPEQVWPYLIEAPKLKQWVSWLAEVRDETPGMVGVGSKSTWVMNDPMTKKQMAIPATITAYDAPNRFSCRIEMAKMFTGDATYKLTPIATGTRVEAISTWHYSDAFSQLMEPFITPEAEKKTRADLANLKKAVESAPEQVGQAGQPAQVAR